MKFFNAAGVVVDEIPLSIFSREKCNSLLEKRGFYMMDALKQEAKEEL